MWSKVLARVVKRLPVWGLHQPADDPAVKILVGCEPQRQVEPDLAWSIRARSRSRNSRYSGRSSI